MLRRSRLSLILFRSPLWTRENSATFRETILEFHIRISGCMCRGCDMPRLREHRLDVELFWYENGIVCLQIDGGFRCSSYCTATGVRHGIPLDKRAKYVRQSECKAPAVRTDGRYLMHAESSYKSHHTTTWKWTVQCCDLENMENTIPVFLIGNNAGMT